MGGPMTWFKLDDGFADHPKVVEAGPNAAWLYVAGLCYCSRNLTDGVIPSAMVQRLTTLAKPGRLAATLVAVGLWEECPAGYMVHDYGAHQRSRAEVDALRGRWREKKGKQRGQTDLSPAMSPGDNCESPRGSLARFPLPEADTDTDTELSRSLEGVTTVRVPPRKAMADAEALHIREAQAQAEWDRMWDWYEIKGQQIGNVDAAWRRWLTNVEPAPIIDYPMTTDGLALCASCKDWHPTDERCGVNA